MDQSVEFGMFVRSVTGHAVPRYGTTELIGATREVVNRETKQAGAPAITWSDRVVALPKQYCVRFTKEMQQHLDNGELKLCTREEWDSQCKADEAKQLTEESERKAQLNTDDKSGKADDK